MNKSQQLELYRRNLFDNVDENLPEDTKVRLIRIRSAFTHWHEFPMKSETDIRDFIMNHGCVSQSMAYYDLELIKILLGSVTNASKEWHRYRFIAWSEEAIQMAKDKHDVKAFVLAIDKYGKYTQLNIPDPERQPYDEIVNQPFEPTSDPSHLGILPDPDIDKKKKKLYEKYFDLIDHNVQDVEYVELITNDAE